MTKALPQPQSQQEDRRLKQIAYLKEYRQKNAVDIAAKAKAKYQENREAILAQKKEYTKRTKEQRAAYLKKRYAENRDEILAKAKAAREGKRAELAAWQRAYRKANPEIMAKRDKERYQKRREMILKQKSEWGKTPEGKIKQKAKNQTRRTRKKLVAHSLTSSELKDLVGKAKGRCFYCQEKLPLSLDHIIPICKGGPHTRDNVVMACRSCNSSKGAKDPMKFARERGMLLI